MLKHWENLLQRLLLKKVYLPLNVIASTFNNSNKKFISDPRLTMLLDGNPPFMGNIFYNL